MRRQRFGTDRSISLLSSVYGSSSWWRTRFGSSSFCVRGRTAHPNPAGVGLLTVEEHGRHRYYRLATPHVEGVLEALARLAPQRPINSLRGHSRCAPRGRVTATWPANWGVSIFHGMIAHGWVIGGDGQHHPEEGIDRLSASGRAHRYRLSDSGAAALADWGLSTPKRKPLAFSRASLVVHDTNAAGRASACSRTVLVDSPNANRAQVGTVNMSLARRASQNSAIAAVSPIRFPVSSSILWIR